MAIDFLTIGNITHDRIATGIRLGGTVSYAAVAVQRLGHHPAILTRGTLEGVSEPLHQPAPAEDGSQGEPGSIEMLVLPSPVSTTFTNIYRDGRRIQVIEAEAGPISPQDLPSAWAVAPTVLLGPIAHELPDAWATAFPHALLGISAQGWLRTWDAAGHVSSKRWDSAPEFLRRADVLFLSRDDVGGDDAYLATLRSESRLMVVTDGWRGSTVYCDGQIRQLPPRPTREVDPTGAGDVFAASFMVRLAETADPFEAARFANVVASFSVEAAGMDAIPQRRHVEAWLAQAAR
jgi:1D-myo-inositol 3-kinase